MSVPVEAIAIQTKYVTCSGEKGSCHPRVYLTIGDQNFVNCPYCGRHYVLNSEGQNASPVTDRFA